MYLWQEGTKTSGVHCPTLADHESKSFIGVVAEYLQALAGKITRSHRGLVCLATHGGVTIGSWQIVCKQAVTLRDENRLLEERNFHRSLR